MVLRSMRGCFVARRVIFCYSWSFVLLETERTVQEVERWGSEGLEDLNWLG